MTGKWMLAAVAAGMVLVTAACSSEDGAASATDDSEVRSKPDCDIQKVLCEITPPRCAEGQTPSVRGDCYGPCVRIDQCKPSTYECNRGPALCEIVPPSCPAGQTLTTENGCFGPCVPSTVCKGASEPARTADCDISKITCELFPLACPDGEAPTVDADGFCYGGCVPIAQCKPGSYACDRGGPALCEIVPPRCGAGERLTTRDGCFGPCVPADVCQ